MAWRTSGEDVGRGRQVAGEQQIGDPALLRCQVVNRIRNAESQHDPDLHRPVLDFVSDITERTRGWGWTNDRTAATVVLILQYATQYQDDQRRADGSQRPAEGHDAGFPA